MMRNCLCCIYIILSVSMIYSGPGNDTGDKRKRTAHTLQQCSKKHANTVSASRNSYASYHHFIYALPFLYCNCMPIIVYSDVSGNEFVSHNCDDR